MSANTIPTKQVKAFAERLKRHRGATKRKKTKKPSKVSILRSWGLLGTEWMRYKNPIEKGIYWYFFSLAVRTRDVAQFGVCISCGKPVTVDTSDAGHFIPASRCGSRLLFGPRNVNAECSQCNAWDDLHLLGYSKNLDLRYGAGTAENLLEQHRALKLSPVVKDFTRKEYQVMLTKLKENGL